MAQEVIWQGSSSFQSGDTPWGLYDSDNEFTLLGEYDLSDPNHMDIGYNTGFELIRIVNEFGESDSVEINGSFYHYKLILHH